MSKARLSFGCGRPFCPRQGAAPWRLRAVPRNNEKKRRGQRSQSKAKDADGLTHVKNDNAAMRPMVRRTFLSIFGNCSRGEGIGNFDKANYWFDNIAYDLLTASDMLKTRRLLYVGLMCYQT